MKKYFLTALLGAFCLFGFASADTVGNFTSESEISYSNFTDSSELGYDLISGDFYFCISSSDFPYYVKNGGISSSIYVNSAVYCSSSKVIYSDEGLYIYNVADFVDSNDMKEISGTVYISDSPITYSSSSGGSSGGSSSGPILNATGQAYLGNVLSGVQSVVSEFIPYMIYVALAVLVVTLGFVAVKWLMNWTSRRVTGLFSSRRKR